MHEMSLMHEIIQLVSEDAKSRGFYKVKQIQVIVGDLSNVLPDALELAFFYFSKKKMGLLDEESQLKIIHEKAIAQCQTCLHKFEPDFRLALCPKCGLLNGFLISGETFQVESYEGSDEIEN
ncbi:MULTISPECIES: hydrogenase maturation nickel metallochaperone HypA [Lysinibacillus]|uniref:Hydrogenase maturation factor HypA n=1 Tax=Lysinibacillus antri TaxID=2498145 RepID=A0A432L872_9BACI|nr:MULTISPECIES: hydrogenase maturation nickel metallochaperone HypA [Lysinibacillus]RUL48632.1 hydrogenase maturation nickel metallochaperone HypA [Lysinibacillus antri]TSI09709.1 hydrogenase maturation nickel metallochaperone HypA [Lysinibacillus sp. BW-2-10]